MTPTASEAPQIAHGLFRHSRRPEWGLAILTSVERDRRVYQFEDGTSRTFRDGFYHLLDEVDCPDDESAKVLGELRKAADLTDARKERKASGAEVITLKDQRKLFADVYAGGFDDPAWQKDVRGTDAKRPLKKHRLPALNLAKTHLSAETMDAAIKAEDYGTIVEGIIAVARATSLVRATEVAALGKLDEEQREELAKAAHELLHTEETPLTFKRWLNALKKSGAVTWPLATAIPALVHPDERVFIQPSAVRAQARWMAPRLTVSKEPTHREYLRAHSMILAVADRLRESGLNASDLIDVTDFMWATLRPSARKAVAPMPVVINTDDD